MVLFYLLPQFFGNAMLCISVCNLAVNMSCVLIFFTFVGTNLMLGFVGAACSIALLSTLATGWVLTCGVYRKFSRRLSAVLFTLAVLILTSVLEAGVV